ncbi:hypothetical protein [Orrella sp. 11846]
MRQGLATWIGLHYDATLILAAFFEHVKNAETSEMAKKYTHMEA